MLKVARGGLATLLGKVIIMMMKRSRSPVFISRNTHFSTRAFTLIELLVSIAIFTLMTALVVAKYGAFNQSVLLTNLAYEVALTLRTAQTYGSSVKNSDPNAPTPAFNHAYGVHFDTDTGADAVLSNGNNNNNEIVFFADINGNDDGVYSNDSEAISAYAIKRGAVISGVCVGVGCTPVTGSHHLDVTFKRPDPRANICYDALAGSPCATSPYAEITIKGTDGSLRVVSVRENGQISVKD